MKNDKDIKFEQPSEGLLMVNRYIIVIMAVIILGVLAIGYFVLLQPKIDEIKAIEQTTEEEGGRRLNNEKLLRKIEELSAEYENIKEERSLDLESLKKILPNNPQVAELFVMSDKLAAERGFELSAITISENIENDRAVEQAAVTADEEGDVAYEKSNEEKAIEELVEVYGDLKSLTIHLTLNRYTQFEEDKNGDMVETSPYESFKGYLSDLESNLRLIDIKSVTFGALVEPGSDEDEEEGGLGESAEEESITFSLDIITYYR
jgi:hypothetical protein